MLCRYCLMMLIVRYRSSNQPLARTHASRVEIKAILERDDLNMTADTVTPGPREKCDTRDKTGNACQTVPHFFTQGSRLVLPINRSFFSFDNLFLVSTLNHCEKLELEYKQHYKLFKALSFMLLLLYK